jgi:hypothetical protein
MWEGSVFVSTAMPCRPLGDGRECDTLVQRQDDIEVLMDYLSEEEQENLTGGFTVVVTSIPGDYLVHE